MPRLISIRKILQASLLRQVSMRFSVFTLFPDLFGPCFDHGTLGRACEKGLISYDIHDIRKYGIGNYRQVDDEPYGGGSGMIIRPEPIFQSVMAAAEIDFSGIENLKKRASVVLLSPSGAKFNQKMADSLAKENWILLICGRYEGVDGRIEEKLCTHVISIGDYVLSGGELPAMVLMESVARLIPGVLGNEASIISESFSEGLLEHPQYTRPFDYMDMKVPEVLVSGNHKAVDEWKREASINRTRFFRPDMIEKDG